MSNKRGKLLYYLSDKFEGFEPRAVWDDVKYVGSRGDEFDKVALVSAPGWVEWTVKIFGHFVKAEVKTFPAGQLDNAWNWLES